MLTAWTHIRHTSCRIITYYFVLFRSFNNIHMVILPQKKSPNVSLIRYKSRSKGKSDKYTHIVINYIVTWLYSLRITKVIALFLRVRHLKHIFLSHTNFLNYLFESFHYDQLGHSLWVIALSEANTPIDPSLTHDLLSRQSLVSINWRGLNKNSTWIGSNVHNHRYYS